MPPIDHGAPEETPPSGLIVPLDIVPGHAHPAALPSQTPPKSLPGKPYSPERQRDWVRLIVTCGFLLILGYLVVFATVECTSYPIHWAQTKEMLQIILPALTGIIGTVIGFYFGTAAAANGNKSGDDLS